VRPLVVWSFLVLAVGATLAVPGCEDDSKYYADPMTTPDPMGAGGTMGANDQVQMANKTGL